MWWYSSVDLTYQLDAGTVVITKTEKQQLVLDGAVITGITNILTVNTSCPKFTLSNAKYCIQHVEWNGYDKHTKQVHKQVEKNFHIDMSLPTWECNGKDGGYSVDHTHMTIEGGPVESLSGEVNRGDSERGIVGDGNVEASEITSDVT